MIGELLEQRIIVADLKPNYAGVEEEDKELDRKHLVDEYLQLTATLRGEKRYDAMVTYLRVSEHEKKASELLCKCLFKESV